VLDDHRVPAKRLALSVQLGVPGISSVRCRFDRARGTLRIVRGSLLAREWKELPLWLIEDVYVRRDSRKLTWRYAAVLSLKNRSSIRIEGFSRHQVKRAMRRIQQFLRSGPKTSE